MNSLSLYLSIPTPLIPKSLPARDRAIPFGKHKGRMLGTLPSKYLNWVSSNLRARDFQEWAELADEVLADPVYRDRIEWESAQRILTGDDISASSSPVSDLKEISGGFGWDNEDKDGWARVDFDLLGTSKGGRIPRVNGTSSRRDGKVVVFGDDDDDDDGKVEKEEEEQRSKLEVSVRGKREERRERRRVRVVKKEVDGGGSGCGSGRIRVVEKEADGGGIGSGKVERASPFPGRGALLNKIDRRV